MVYLVFVQILLIVVVTQLVQANQVINIQNRYSVNDVEELDRSSLSFPGTKWCGPGNTASGFDDLGKFMETDKCCRAHDNCDNIASGETKYGLTNSDPFTVLHCDCDKEFNDCLQNSKEEVAPVIGENYFLLRSRCYKEEYPIKGCQEYDRLETLRSLIFRRCIKYDLDTSQPKRYQWFNLPFYGGKGFRKNSKIGFTEINRNEIYDSIAYDD